jgi:uncharacterized protein YggE
MGDFRDSTVGRAIAMAVSIAGAVYLVAHGAIDVGREVRCRREGVVAQGSIQAKYTKRIPNLRTLFHSDIDEALVGYTFTTSTSEKVEGEAPIARDRWDALHTGDSIPIRYVPSRPTVNRIEGEPLPIGEGVCVIALGGLILFMARSNVRHTRGITRALIAGVLTAAACAGCGRAAALADTKADKSTVTMSGTGTIRRAPDIATLRLRVDARGPRPAPAQQRASEIASALTTRLRQLQVADQNIQTVSYDLSRDYDYIKGQQVFRAWVASHVFDIRVEDIARLGDIIDAIESAGPIAIEGPHFELKARAAAYADALKLAVADARAKAEAAAQGSGARVARIVSVDEQGAATPDRRAFDGLAARPQAPTPTTVAPGELTIEARVSLTAEIR